MQCENVSQCRRLLLFFLFLSLSNTHLSPMTSGWAILDSWPPWVLRWSWRTIRYNSTYTHTRKMKKSYKKYYRCQRLLRFLGSVVFEFAGLLLGRTSVKDSTRRGAGVSWNCLLCNGRKSTLARCSVCFSQRLLPAFFHRDYILTVIVCNNTFLCSSYTWCSQREGPLLFTLGSVGEPHIYSRSHG